MIKQLSLLFVLIFAAILLSTSAFFVAQTQESDQCFSTAGSTAIGILACESTTSDSRPINATVLVEVRKNITWLGFSDWSPYLARGSDFYCLKINSCYLSQLEKGKITAGDQFKISVICTMVPWLLQQRDYLFFAIRTTSSPLERALASIKIPGYRSQPLELKNQVWLNLPDC